MLGNSDCDTSLKWRSMQKYSNLGIFLLISLGFVLGTVGGSDAERNLLCRVRQAEVAALISYFLSPSRYSACITQ